MPRPKLPDAKVKRIDIRYSPEEAAEVRSVLASAGVNSSVLRDVNLTFVRELDAVLAGAKEPGEACSSFAGLLADVARDARAARP